MHDCDEDLPNGGSTADSTVESTKPKTLVAPLKPLKDANKVDVCVRGALYDKAKAVCNICNPQVKVPSDVAT